MQHECLQQLTALTQLTVMGCGLLSVPADVAFSCATLCELDLSRNEQLQIDDNAVDATLSCRQLKVLGLHMPDPVGWLEALWQLNKPPEADIPTKWSTQNSTRLQHISDAFSMRHGRPLKIALTQDEYDTHFSVILE